MTDSNTQTAILQQKVETMDKRLDSVHSGFRSLDTEFRAHDKLCAERWTEGSIKLKAIMWGIRVAGGGVILMLLKDIWELTGTI